MFSPRITCLVVAVFLMAWVRMPAQAGTEPDDVKAEAILQRADAHVANVRDFTAALVAQAHVAFMPSWDLTGRLYFKRPNHLKVDVENMPRLLTHLRRNMQVQPPYQNRKQYSVHFMRSDTVGSAPCDVIEFRARNSSDNLRSVLAWVDRARGIVPRTEMTYADGTRVGVETVFASTQGYMLPHTSQVKVTASALHVDVDVTYSNYVINANLPDSVFAPR